MDKKTEKLIEHMDLCMPRIIEALRNARSQFPWAGELNINQGNILAMLSTETPQTMTRLSETTGLALSALTNLTHHLLQKGFVEKKQSDKDGRSFLLDLTPEGKPLADKIRDARTKNMEMILARIPEGEREAAVDGYCKLVKAFQEVSKG